MADLYSFRKPQKTYTIQDFIACQSDTEICHNNLSFIDEINYKHLNLTIKYNTYNVLSDYIDEVRDEYCVPVTLSVFELDKYKYRPKLLCYDVYGNGELGFIILVINDMYSVKQFIKSKLLLPTRTNMSTICKYIYNTNAAAMHAYYKKNK